MPSIDPFSHYSPRSDYCEKKKTIFRWKKRNGVLRLNILKWASRDQIKSCTCQRWPASHRQFLCSPIWKVDGKELGERWRKKRRCCFQRIVLSQCIKHQHNVQTKVACRLPIKGYQPEKKNCASDRYGFFFGSYPWDYWFVVCFGLRTAYFFVFRASSMDFGPQKPQQWPQPGPVEY